MKFLNSIFCEKTGISLVSIEHKGEIYAGKAKLHPEEAFASKIYGCQYAEHRAIMKALKAEYKEKKKALRECEKFVTAVSQYKNFDKNSPTAKAMYRQLNMRRKEIETVKIKIESVQSVLKAMIESQDIIASRIAKIKQDN